MSRIRSLALSLLFSSAAVAQMPIPVAPPQMAPPASAPASQPADVAAIQKTLADYNAAVAKGDVPALLSFVVVSTDTQKQAMALMGRLTSSGRGVYQSVADAFGEAELAKGNVDRQSFPAGFPAMPAEAMEIRPDGDKATLINRMAAEAPPLAMKRIDGQWKIDGDALLPALTDKQLQEQTTVLDAAIGAIDQTAADIKAKHFRAPDEAVVLMNHRVQKAVRAAQEKLTPMADPSMPPAAGPATSPAQ